MDKSFASSVTSEPFGLSNRATEKMHASLRKSLLPPSPSFFYSYFVSFRLMLLSCALYCTSYIFWYLSCSGRLCQNLQMKKYKHFSPFWFKEKRNIGDKRCRSKIILYLRTLSSNKFKVITGTSQSILFFLVLPVLKSQKICPVEFDPVNLWRDIVSEVLYRFIL